MRVAGLALGADRDGAAAPSEDRTSSCTSTSGPARSSGSAWPRPPASRWCCCRTSGTAAAEFHPAVVEAFHSRTPLIVLTADRPPELRDVGANQAIDQQRLYGTAVRWFFDPGAAGRAPNAARLWRRLAARAYAEAPNGPVHLNLPFREPLVPPPGQVPAPLGESPQAMTAGRLLPTSDQVASARLGAAATRSGRWSSRARCATATRLAPALNRLGVPLLAEPSSQLRRPESGAAVESYEALLRAGWSLQHGPDLVIRLGGTPTSKVHERVARRRVRRRPSSSIRTGRGATRTRSRATSWSAIRSRCSRACRRPTSSAWRDEWVSAGKKATAAIAATLVSTPMHEGHIVRALAARLPDTAQVFVGSSMPIRAADSFWPHARGAAAFYGNRGASGIDGLVSTGLGLAAGAQPRSDSAASRRPLPLSRHERAVVAAPARHQGDDRRLRQQRRRCLQLPAAGAAHRTCSRRSSRRRWASTSRRSRGSTGSSTARSPTARASSRRSPTRSRAQTSTMVVVRYKREDSVNGHRVCWEAAAAALRA